jgi:hypothetical protein
MLEQKWHEEVRLEKIAELEKQGLDVRGSHKDNPKIELYRNEKKTENRLSDADIAVFNPQDKTISQIIEIESQLNPKKIIGIVLATHFCSKCSYFQGNARSGEDLYMLKEKSVTLVIIYKTPRNKSRKADKLKVIMEPLKEIVKNTQGCLIDFSWKEHK